MAVSSRDPGGLIRDFGGDLSDWNVIVDVKTDGEASYKLLSS